MTISSISQIQPQNLWAELSQLGNNSSTSAATTSTPQDPAPQLSPASQFLNMLQNMQQQNPTEFKQITQQIATRLQNAAQAATQQGNNTNAAALAKLAQDFQGASQTGQMPSTQQLQTDASGLTTNTEGAHHAHHHHHAYSSESQTSSSTSDPLSALFGSLASQSQTYNANGISSLLGSM